MSVEKLRYFLFSKINRKQLIPLVRELLDGVSCGRKAVVACLNPHSFVAAEGNPRFHNSLANADVLLADGVGISLAVRMLRAPPAPRISGQDFFFEILRQTDTTHKTSKARRIRCFFFGSSERVLKLIHTRLVADYSQIEFCGSISPPFGDWSDAADDEFVMMINSAKPDILWVGMTAPKQEMGVERNRCRLEVSVIGSIGAVFDFYAGTYKRAPDWACRLGIEWLFRLLKEPRRMWRRNFVSTPRFLWLVAKARCVD